MTDPSVRTHVRTCPLCEATCGLELRIEGDEVTRVRGDRDDVFSRGFLCPKGAVLHHVHSDPDRLRTPQIRTADGTHRDATWDEAFAEIDRLLVPSRAAHGPGSTAVYVGNPNVHGPALFTLQALISAISSPNLFTAGTVDQLPREIANGFLYGDPRMWPIPDIDRTDLLVILGANPVVSGGSLATAPDWPGRLAAIRARGGRVVVVDPRRTETAAVADEWIGVRPGTDALLLAAVVATLFDEGLVDLGAATAYCDGVDEVGAALAPFTAERVAPHTGIGADRIRELARALHGTQRAVVYGRVGLQTHAFGTLASWLTDLVNILSGNLDRAGGLMFATPAVALPFVDDEYPDGFRVGRWHSRVSHHPECRGEFPTAALAEEILTPGDGQVRSMVVLAGNPARSCPDSARIEEAISGLECLVSVDVYRNETSRYAHVILPPPSHLERSHFDLFFYPMAVRNVANWSGPTFAPAGPSEEDIHLRLTGLIGGMGTDPDLAVLRSFLIQGIAAMAVPGSDVSTIEAELHGATVFDKLVDLLLRAGPHDLDLATLQQHPHGVDLGPLVPRLPDALRTRNRRIDLVPPSIRDDLPRLVERLDRSPDVGHLLIGRRQLRSNNSWMHNVEVLMRGSARCTALMHPSDADSLGLDDGDLVEIRSSAGSVRAPVERSADLVAGVVSLPHGWGHDVEGQRVAMTNPGVNSNVLTDASAIDPLSGVCSINGIPVTLHAPEGIR